MVVAFTFKKRYNGEPILPIRAALFLFIFVVISSQFGSAIGRAGHRKFTLNSATANSAKLQEVFRNDKSASLR